MSQFLKINQSVPIYVYVCLPIYLHKLFVLFLWITLTNTVCYKEKKKQKRRAEVMRQGATAGAKALRIRKEEQRSGRLEPSK